VLATGCRGAAPRCRRSRLRNGHGRFVVGFLPRRAICHRSRATARGSDEPSRGRRSAERDPATREVAPFGAGFAATVAASRYSLRIWPLWMTDASPLRSRRAAWTESAGDGRPSRRSRATRRGSQQAGPRECTRRHRRCPPGKTRTAVTTTWWPVRVSSLPPLARHLIGFRVIQGLFCPWS
jgi:hypothetical protein